MNPSHDEIIGRICRQESADRKALAFVDAQLSDTANLFRKAATQIDCLLANEPSELGPALAKINMDHILKVLAQRQQLQRRLADAHALLKLHGARK